jgi:hypothetical protein
VGRKTERTAIKVALGILIGLLLCVFLGWGGYRIYSVVESRHLTRRAEAYLGGGELRETVITARRALQLHQSNIDAVRILAAVAERANDKSALAWRRKAIELKPDSIEDKLAFVQSAVQFKDVAPAEKTLRHLPEEARRTAEFHAAAAKLAEIKNDMSAAEEHWAEAAKLASQNSFYQLRFGLALLRMDDAAKRTVGLALLEKLRGDKEQRSAATRALIFDGIAHRVEGQKLVAMARALKDYPEATFNDRLLYLEILRQLGDPQFTRYLSEMEKEAASNPVKLAALVSWMNANKLSLLAIDFARILPDGMVAKWPVPLTIAESYSKIADWPELESRLRNQDWGEFDSLRHAYLSLALREQGKPVVADQEWALAQKQASAQVTLLSLLSRTISSWTWKKENLDLLWMLARHPETQLEALQALYENYTEQGDTPGLYRVLTRLAELLPDDHRIQNNLAQLRLLLNTDIDRAETLSAQLHSNEPANPFYASTYAFALYSVGDIEGALEIMNGLHENQLRNPALATYYGIVLAAAGEEEKAKKYLTIAASGKLLPEERALVTKAEESLK